MAAEGLPLFLGSVVAISITGVMMPGPVTAATVARGSRHRGAGAAIALGHGLVEFPLMAGVYLGLAQTLALPGVKIGVGLAGGLVLLWMALQVVKAQPAESGGVKGLPRSSAFAGLMTTAANPYFFLWWATVGAALLTEARLFGVIGLVSMGLVHWLCDLGWLSLVSMAVFKSKRLWTPKAQRVVYGACAAVLAGFGAWFLMAAVTSALTG